MRITPILLGGAILGVAGCAMLGRGAAPDPEARIELGIAALRQNDFDHAQEQFEGVFDRHRTELVGQKALLLLIATEMSPRNPTRSLRTAADLADRWLTGPTAEDWMAALALTFQQVAAEQLDIRERLAEARDEPDGPTPEQASSLALIHELTMDRDSLRTRAASLAAQLDETTRQLTEKTAELERIRKAVRGGGGGGGG